MKIKLGNFNRNGQELFTLTSRDLDAHPGELIWILPLPGLR